MYLCRRKLTNRSGGNSNTAKIKMKTYNVQKRVNTGSNTEIFDTVSFDCLDKAEEKFIEILAVQETSAEVNDTYRF